MAAYYTGTSCFIRAYMLCTYVYGHLGTVVKFSVDASSKGEGKRGKREREKPASEEPLVMIRPLTLTPWLDGELVALGRWSPLIHASQVAHGMIFASPYLRVISTSRNRVWFSDVTHALREEPKRVNLVDPKWTWSSDGSALEKYSWF